MKWVFAVAISLLLVALCVIYLRNGMRPIPPPVSVSQGPSTKPPKRLPPKPSPEGPIDISGPLKDRGLLSWVMPEYPEWAQEKEVIGTVRLKVWVNPAGEVHSGMETYQMTADPRLDEKAKEAIRQWRFIEKPNTFGDQWGIVTVRFSLLSQDVSPEASLRGFSLGGSTTSGTWRCVKEWIGNEYRYLCRRVRPKSDH